jgi:hypothetical protein
LYSTIDGGEPQADHSTGKKGNAEVGRRTKLINRMDGQKFTSYSHIGNEMTPEFPTGQPFGQGLNALEIQSAQQNVPSSEVI